MIFYMKLKKREVTGMETTQNINNYVYFTRHTQFAYYTNISSKKYIPICAIFQKEIFKGTYPPNPTEMDMQLNFYNCEKIIPSFVDLYMQDVGYRLILCGSVSTSR